MRIAYFIDRLIAGGTELQLLEQIHRLQLKGVDQKLYCLYKSEEHDKLNIACQTQILDVYSLARWSTLRKIWQVAKEMRHSNTTVAQAYFFDSTFFGIISALLGRVKWRISCRRDMGFWYTRRLVLFLRILNSLSTKVLVNCRSVKNNVVRRERLKPSKVDILQNGIETSIYYVDPEKRKTCRNAFHLKDEFCVGIVANMSRRVKRVDLFIEAAALCLQKRKDMKFFILGEGSLKEELIQLRDGLDLTKNCIFLDRTTDKMTLLGALDAGVITSDSEGLSNSIIEYMASGLPCVATDVGGNPELVNDGVNGFLTEVGDASQLAERLVTLAEDPHLIDQFRKKATETVADYDWNQRIAQMLEYYQTLSGVESK